MKIAFFLNQFPVLSETFILNQITGLIDRGHQVDIYARRRGEQPDVHSQVAEYQLHHRTRYIDEHDRGFSERVLRSVALLGEGGCWRRMETWKFLFGLLLRKRGHPSLTMLTLLDVGLQQIRHGRYDVVHSQYGNLGRLVFSLRRVGVVDSCMITAFRGHDATQHEKTGDGFYTELFRDGDLFLPVSRSLRDRILAMGCDANKISVLHSGIDCSRFTYVPRNLMDADEAVKIVTVARLVEMKGVEYGIRAVAALIGEGVQVQYTVVGDGPLKDHLLALIAQLGMEQHISLAGWKAQNDVLAILGCAHIMLAPSVTASNGEAEGIPNAVKEAMALGMPVVSTLHSGIPELVEDGVSGYLVAERDVEAMMACLRGLLEHPERWAAMGAAGRRQVEEAFDTHQLTDQLVELYDECRAGKNLSN